MQLHMIRLHNRCLCIRHRVFLYTGAPKFTICTLCSVASQAPLIVETASTSSICNDIAQYLTSSIPCTSLARLSKEETFAEATSLPVVNVRSVERRGVRCIKAEVGQLMRKVEMLKGSGLSRSSTMGGHFENGKWVNLTGGIKSLNW